MRIRPLLFAVLFPTAVVAQISPDSPMVQALRDGRASVPAPESQGAQVIVEKELIMPHTRTGIATHAKAATASDRAADQRA